MQKKQQKEGTLSPSNLMEPIFLSEQFSKRDLI